MDLRTQYMGLELDHPLVAGASPLTGTADMAGRLQDAGAAAIVMHSLFEEQITNEQLATNDAMKFEESFPEATTYLPDPQAFAVGPQEYLSNLEKIKAALDIPVIASLNGHTQGGWLSYAKMLEQAGADAIEMNVYDLATDPDRPALDIEQATLEMIRQIKAAVSVPVAVKLSPFYTSFSNFAARCDQAGADALVIFNRFYQPDIDVETLEVQPFVNLSTSAELLLRLRWLAILSNQVSCSLAATGGVHTAHDAVKAVMTGAHCVQMVSALLRHGPGYVKRILQDMVQWMEEFEYESIAQMRGSMSHEKSGNPDAYERTNYMQVLQSWRV